MKSISGVLEKSLVSLARREHRTYHWILAAPQASLIKLPSARARLISMCGSFSFRSQKGGLRNVVNCKYFDVHWKYNVPEVIKALRLCLGQSFFKWKKAFEKNSNSTLLNIKVSGGRLCFTKLILHFSLDLFTRNVKKAVTTVWAEIPRRRSPRPLPLMHAQFRRSYTLSHSFDHCPQFMTISEGGNVIVEVIVPSLDCLLRWGQPHPIHTVHSFALHLAW